MSRESGDFNEDRAELFEALGHPTRITVLQILSKSSLGFSDLKREAGIDSNGLLSFHLGKLENLDLVRTSDGGNYQLTDEGREALRIVAAKDKYQPDRSSNRNRMLQIITVAVIVALAFSVYFNYSLQNNNYQQTLALNVLNQSYNNRTLQYDNLLDKFYSGGVASELSNNSVLESTAVATGAKYFSLNTSALFPIPIPYQNYFVVGMNETPSTVVQGYIWDANGTFISGYTAFVDPTTLQIESVYIYQLVYFNSGSWNLTGGSGMIQLNTTDIVPDAQLNVTAIPLTSLPVMSDYIVYAIQNVTVANSLADGLANDIQP